MKCDELKYEHLDEAFETYPDSTLVIRKQYVDAAIDELKAENDRLVKCCKEYDSRQRIDENVKFNGAEQLRKTKRALWLSRARAAETGRRFWAKENIFAWREGRKRDADKALKMEKRRERQAALFTAKAEEYK